jgi:hypothetical protein
MTDAVEQQQQPAPPPATSEAAHARLGELTADKAWGAKLVAGDTAVRAEFDSLSRLVSGTDTAPTAEQFAARSERAANDRNTVSFINGVRESVDVSDGVLAQVIGGEKVSKAEFDAAKQWFARHSADESWVKRLLSGDSEARKEHFLASVILSSGIKEEK